MTAQPDDPGPRPGPANGRDRGGNRRHKSWRYRLAVGSFLTIFVTLTGWLGTELFDIVKDQLRMNTEALVQNQEFIRTMAVEQSLQGAEIGGLGRDVERVRLRQNNLWSNYMRVNTQLVRLMVLHERDDE